MSGYFKAYGERMHRNDQAFRALAEGLKLRGCIVFAPKNKLINFIKVFKDNEHCVIEFRQVPYSWAVSIGKKPDKKVGSAFTLETCYGEDMPYTVEGVLSKLRVNPQVKDFTNPFYLEKL